MKNALNFKGIKHDILNSTRIHTFMFTLSTQHTKYSHLNALKENKNKDNNNDNKIKVKIFYKG